MNSDEDYKEVIGVDHSPRSHDDAASNTRRSLREEVNSTSLSQLDGIQEELSRLRRQREQLTQQRALLLSSLSYTQPDTVMQHRPSQNLGSDVPRQRASTRGKRSAGSTAVQRLAPPEAESVCMMGFFLAEDNSHSYSFSREGRFKPVILRKGMVFYAGDETSDRSGVATSGSVVPPSVGTPGPGAYTPLYNKQSKPSVRIRV